MSKIYFFIFTVISVLVLLIATVVMLRQRATHLPASPVTPPISTTPNPSAPVSVVPLKLTNTIPENGSRDAAVDKQPSLTFNRPLSQNEVDIFIGPTIDYKVIFQGNTIIIAPTKPLLPGVTYSLQVRFLQDNRISPLISFTTAGATPKVLPDTQPPGLAQDVEKFNLQNHPDVFLANKTPYFQAEFSIQKGGYKTGEPDGHFYFLVTLRNDPTTSKSVFVAWLKSLGLTNDQIQSLDITYQ